MGRSRKTLHPEGQFETLVRERVCPYLTDADRRLAQAIVRELEEERLLVDRSHFTVTLPVSSGFPP